MEKEIKPNKKVFLWFGFWKSAIILFIIFLLFYITNLFLFQFSILYFLTGFLLLIGLNYISLKKRYEKEVYIFLGDRIIKKSGGIFSDSETELVVRNITNVIMRIPYIENNLFHTGKIIIECAGSDVSKIYFSSIKEYEEVYSRVARLMKKNGFRLSKNKLVQSEEPDTLGVFLETLGVFISIFLFIFIFGLSMIASFISRYFLIASLSFLLIIIGLSLGFVFSYLNLKRRKYNLYSDTITYEEGFLNRDYAFIPIENLADSSVTQKIIERILGIYDVKISSQGSGRDILFKNMRNGRTLEKNIDKLIDENKFPVKKVNEVKKVKEKPQKLDLRTDYSRKFRMDFKRSVMGLLIALPICIILFPLLFFWIPSFISIIIRVFTTEYELKKNSVEERVEFLSTKHREFTNDKITGVVFYENFIDRWLGTCSVKFWSIGSSKNIKLTNIKKTNELYENVLLKAGIDKSKVVYNMNPRFNLGDFFKSNIYFHFIAFVLFIISIIASLFYALILFVSFLIVVVYVLFGVYTKRVYNNAEFNFFNNHLMYSKGIFFNRKYYSRYENVKDIKTIKYPGSRNGDIVFNIAGEEVVQTDKGSFSRPNHFQISYVSEIQSKDELIDLILEGKLSLDKIKEFENKINSYKPEIILNSKPALSNWIVPMMILVPLWIFIPFVILSLRAKCYRIEDYRVVARSGVIYKKQLSVVFDKVDYINSSQGFLNKMFKNGNVIVNTAGSSKPEMVVRNIPNFKEFYKLLKKNY